MFCEYCGKNMATYHLKQIINGVTNEKHLCESCAKLYNQYIDIDFNYNNYVYNPFDNIFDDVVSSIIGDSVYASIGNRSIKNENILDQARKSIKTGVMNQENKYKTNPNLIKIEGLRRELQTAVDNENYELAVELKKEIDKLKEQGDV